MRMRLSFFALPSSLDVLRVESVSAATLKLSSVSTFLPEIPKPDMTRYYFRRGLGKLAIPHPPESPRGRRLVEAKGRLSDSGSLATCMSTCSTSQPARPRPNRWGIPFFVANGHHKHSRNVDQAEDMEQVREGENCKRKAACWLRGLGAVRHARGRTTRSLKQTQKAAPCQAPQRTSSELR